MADFNTITDLINEEIVTNGKGDIDAVMIRTILLGMLTAVGENLDGKVDAETGKSLILDTLITKLSNMPAITGFNAQTNRITIGGKEYELTPYVPIPDYYIGWTSGTKSAFAALNESQLKQLATSYMVANNPTYQHACTNIIFFVMFKTDKAPKNGSLVAGGLSSPISAADFLAGGDCPHEPVTIDGTTYKIYGIRNSELVGENNIITINFN